LNVVIGDTVAYALRNYVSDEKLNPSIKESLWKLGANFSAVQDYRETTVQHYQSVISRLIFLVNMDHSL